ncbi:MAG: hypothetical protein LBS23_01440 [Holosporaceae bacterium]|jgi:dihydrofolate synthase/folylpolyglutamate synthase|nr:hypothetical protein [Holosporaceae bacterium]
MKYKDIIHYLEKQTKSHDVDYIKKALLVMELEINPSKVIVVAGTNGKGSTSATLQTLLMTAEKNVGFFSSPHLIKINERIKFNGENISDEIFCNIFLLVHKKIKDLNLSYFEYLTIMAVYYFFECHKNEIDYAIFEAGLGGACDASNAIPHNTSVITKLGFDHELLLGNALIEIAKNKLGIIQPYNNVFHAKFSNEISELSKEYMKKLHCNFIESYQYVLKIDTSAKYPVFKINTKFGDFQINLPGTRGAENTALAVTIFHNLINGTGPTDSVGKFLSALRYVDWPGRMEKFTYKDKDIFFSGDHNPQGVESLVEILNYYKFEKIHFVVGVCHDKNHKQMLEKLVSVKNSHLYLTETPIRTLLLTDYDAEFQKLATYMSKNPTEAMRVAMSKSTENDLVVVTGSLYLVGYIKQIFAKNRL